MVQDFTQGSHGRTVPPVVPTVLPDPEYEHARHLVLGSLPVVRATIKLLHKLKFAEPNDWSKPLPTGRPNEVMAILTKKVRVD